MGGGGERRLSASSRKKDLKAARRLCDSEMS
jgi:hypothetical protein